MDIGKAGAVGVLTTVGFWLIVWVGMPGTIDRLQAERIAIRERDIDNSLKVFIFALLMEMKILFKTLPSRIQRPGSVYLRLIGEMVESKV